jgi:hypothetical protein
MKKTSFAVLFLSIGVSFGAAAAGAQGPAGAGATDAVAHSSSNSGSSHSMNPIKWIKKDKSAPAPSTDKNLLLTEHLHEKGVLAANSDITSACSVFKNLSDCLASLHASHNTGLDFNCIRADVTGVQTNADVSGCKGPIGDKAVSLHDALKRLKPEIDAKSEAKSAEQQAKDDLKAVGA